MVEMRAQPPPGAMVSAFSTAVAVSKRLRFLEKAIQSKSLAVQKIAYRPKGKTRYPR